MSWQEVLKSGYRTPAEVLAAVGVCVDVCPDMDSAHREFETKVPRSFVKRMAFGQANCPLLRQVLPSAEEMQNHPSYTTDPLAESESNPTPGLLHKYHGRVLVTLTRGCAINCRYCFRRHFPYAKNQAGGRAWDRILNYIARDSRIEEVIFSGGDPLLINDDALANKIQQVEAISHISTLRFHTRLPIVLPERITEKFIETLQQTRLKTVIVLHCNHPNEIDAAVKKACNTLKPVSALLNQSVLLKNVNDSEAVLIALSKALFDIDVLPYYLHMPDKIKGTGHFDVETEVALKLHSAMRSQLPGYLVPKLVREVPGLDYKQPLV